MITENTEAFMDAVIIAILNHDPRLRAIPPTAALSDDGEERPECFLGVASSFVGESLRGGIRDYSVTVTLDRQFRQENQDMVDFEALWAGVKTCLSSWPDFIAQTDVAAKIDHLSIDDIEGSGEPSVGNQRQSRSVTFSAWLRPS